MSSEHNTADRAFDHYLRAKYEEEQTGRYAPSRLSKATEKRVAAARALDRMNVDISVMRRQRIDAAVTDMFERLASAGVRATIRRRGTRIVLESPDRLDMSDHRFAGFSIWAKSRGIYWNQSSWPHREGEPVSILQFVLGAPNQESWMPEMDEAVRVKSAVVAEAEPADVFRARRVAVCQAVMDWWAAEGVPVLVTPGDTEATYGDPRPCVILESREKIDALGGAAARFAAWLSSNGLREAQSGGEMRQGIYTQLWIEPGQTRRESVRASHLDTKIEAAMAGVGRATIEHVLRQPVFQSTSSERMKDLAKRIAQAWGISGWPSETDWQEWSG